jgi:hypothetical protein
MLLLHGRLACVLLAAVRHSHPYPHLGSRGNDSGEESQQQQQMTQRTPHEERTEQKGGNSRGATDELICKISEKATGPAVRCCSAPVARHPVLLGRTFIFLEFVVLSSFFFVSVLLLHCCCGGVAHAPAGVMWHRYRCCCR